MIEFPEAINISKQLNAALAGKTVERVFPPTKAHKFCWYHSEPSEYDGILRGKKVLSAQGFGMFAELYFEGGTGLCIDDGVNVRLTDGQIPKNHQLALSFTDGSALVFTVAMYGGIVLHGDDYDNDYYNKSRASVSPLSPEFEAVYRRTLAESKPGLSAKAFLATEQRFPGIGNGVLQDILFDAGINPRRKLSTLSRTDVDGLLCSIRTVIGSMTALGGRDTEKDIYGEPGGYETKMSKNNLAADCPKCGGTITKESYLGGSVYYCPNCQPL